MAKKSRQPVFAVCVDNTGYRASLEAGKLYEMIPDAQAEKQGLVRVIDESGEDYGYAAERFFVLAVPQALRKALIGMSAPKRPDQTLKRSSGGSARIKRTASSRRSRLSV